ncbi:BglG family transcription antiterminator LicT [Vagococcus acidifermentans]|uniref:Transcription antiterminator LicT n=1 Tax=Vagococcus acidifermentans TaxID=564710 RepID=A0A430AWW7_9ENTE|nr:PRD domain-containing protein [Vagococcus acidifermentans]RSU12548.1 transcription antiterminator LicT [Vagococcus acidifermentans]
MKIYRILNNNAVIILDENKEERIVCGPGLAYGKRKGDEIDKKKINKKFVVQNNQTNLRLQQLIEDIPIKNIEVADDIIRYAKLKLGKKISDSLIISLSDHIHSSLIRFKEGISLKNALLWDIKRFYKDEFEIGVEALNIIEKNFHVKLPIDEAAFIATHVVSAETEVEMADINEVTKLMQEILDIVTYFFKVSLNPESVYYYRFVTHLKFFAQRVISGKQYHDDDSDLLAILKKKYHNSFECVALIDEFIEKNYHYRLSDEEQSYLTIHIERLIYKEEH